MRGKQIVLAIVLLFATCSVAWAGKEAYKLVMSKEKELCETVLNMFNRDMRKFRDIRYHEHEMFKRVAWQKFELEEQTYGCELFWQGRFDINNDGNEDLVIKWSACLRDNLSDSFYVFPLNSDVLAKLKPGPEGLAPLFETPNKFQRTMGGYNFSELPLDQTEGLVQGIGGVFVIQPFIWNKDLSQHDGSASRMDCDQSVSRRRPLSGSLLLSRKVSVSTLILVFNSRRAHHAADTPYQLHVWELSCGQTRRTGVSS